MINGLTDLLHPCQAMADIMTIAERSDLEKVAVAYVGDGNNVANRCSTPSRAGRRAAPRDAAQPPAARPGAERALALAAGSGAASCITNDPVEAVRGAHVVYTDVWTSMGQEAEAERRQALFEPFQLNAKLLRTRRTPW